MFYKNIGGALQDDLLLKRMQNLLIENDKSGQLAKTAIDSKQFWKIRRELNNCLEVCGSRNC